MAEDRQMKTVTYKGQEYIGLVDRPDLFVCPLTGKLIKQLANGFKEYKAQKRCETLIYQFYLNNKQVAVTAARLAYAALHEIRLSDIRRGVQITFGRDGKPTIMNTQAFLAEIRQRHIDLSNARKSGNAKQRLAVLRENLEAFEAYYHKSDIRPLNRLVEAARPTLAAYIRSNFALSQDTLEYLVDEAVSVFWERTILGNVGSLNILYCLKQNARHLYQTAKRRREVSLQENCDLDEYEY